MPGQLKDGLPVGIGKTFLRCLPVRQPDRIQMLSRSQDDWKFLRHLKSEYMFRIFCHSRSEPMSPDRKYFENVFDLPVFKTGCGNLMIFRSRLSFDNPDPGFLENFTDRRPDKRFRQRITGTGYRLPEAGAIGAFDQQDIQLFRINDDKNRLGNFVSHIQNETREPSRLPFLSQPG